jgi:hypothetical protein
MCGKIYKIIFEGSNLFYIGSTFSTLQERLREHFGSANSISNKFYDYLKSVETHNIRIHLLKEYPHLIDKKKDKRELEKYETKFVILFDAIKDGLNTNLPYADEERKKETLKNSSEKYREKNREILNEKERLRRLKIKLTDNINEP